MYIVTHIQVTYDYLKANINRCLYKDTAYSCVYMGNLYSSLFKRIYTYIYTCIVTCYVHVTLPLLYNRTLLQTRTLGRIASLPSS